MLRCASLVWSDHTALSMPRLSQQRPPSRRPDECQQALEPVSLSATNRLKPGADSGGAPPGPGPRLRDARRARRLSVDEAARQLKLESAVIEALERDDYAGISAPLYVKGYLAGYARLLDLPEDEVLDGFRRSQGEGASPVIAAERTLGRPARSVDRGVRWFSYGFGIAILAIAAYWGYERWLEDRWASVAPAASVGGASNSPVQLPVDGSEEVPVRGGAFQEITLRTLRDVILTGTEEHVANTDRGMSVVCPALLLEEMVIQKPPEEQSKLPLLPNPYFAEKK